MGDSDAPYTAHDEPSGPLHRPGSAASSVPPYPSAPPGPVAQVALGGRSLRESGNDVLPGTRTVCADVEAKGDLRRLA